MDKLTSDCTDDDCNTDREAKMVTIARNEAGKSTVWCDPCIAPIVKALNDAGIRTIASCCGHKRRPGVIALEDRRELIIARDFDEARRIDKLFPATINDPLTDEAGGMDKTNLPPLPKPYDLQHDDAGRPQVLYTAEQMREYAARAVREAVPDAAPTLQGIPVVMTPGMTADAWIVVPREPTPAMLSAPTTHDSPLDDITRRIWAAMIAAAPTQGQENGS